VWLLKRYRMQMWLLDVNVPVQIIPALEAKGYTVNRSALLGWGELRNGQLVQEATRHGYVCLLTRDKLFEESAASALELNPQFSVVLLTINQATATKYLESFTSALKKSEIKPVPGQITRWP
jgi:predicted nuclease of predicted toxin-antitoxin system